MKIERMIKMAGKIEFKKLADGYYQILKDGKVCGTVAHRSYGWAAQYRGWLCIDKGRMLAADGMLKLVARMEDK
jgi:hypothetical protein